MFKESILNFHCGIRSKFHYVLFRLQSDDSKFEFNIHFKTKNKHLRRVQFKKKKFSIDLNLLMTL